MTDPLAPLSRALFGRQADAPAVADRDCATESDDEPAMREFVRDLFARANADD